MKGPLAAVALALLLGSARGQEAPPGRERGQEKEQEQEQPEQIEEPESPAPRAARPLVPLPETAHFASLLHPRQAPFLIPHRDGRALLGCLRMTLGSGDALELRDVTTLQGNEGNLPIRRASGPPAEIVRPTGVVDGKGRVLLLWTELVDGRPQLRAAREAGAAFAAPVTLTTTPTPNLNPEAVLHSDGRVWVAWESDVVAREGARASRDVLLASIEEGPGDDLKLGTPLRVGTLPGSDLDANVASAGGRLWVVWSGYLGRDYEILARSFDPATGVLSDPINVSSDGAGDDVHSTIAASTSGALWIAWDRVAIDRRGASAPADLRFRAAAEAVDVSIRCACVRDGRVLLPKAPAGAPAADAANGVVPGAPRLSTGGGLPRIALARDGAVWIAYRYLLRTPGDRRRYGFPVLVQRLGAGGWSDPLEAEGSVGMPETPALVADPAGSGVLVAFQADARVEIRGRERNHVPEQLDRPLTERGVACSTWNGVAEIGFARASLPAAVTSGESPLVERPLRLDPPHFHPAADRLDDPFVNGEQHYQVARGADRWSVWWGDLHRHSSISRCTAGAEPTPEDRWTSGRDVHLCDFMALTDHCGAIDPVAWWQLDKLGWLYQSPTFCTLLGWEWSTVEWGHHNVILRDRMTPLVSEQTTIDELWKSLRRRDCVTIPHHSSERSFPNDFAAIDDRFTRLIEIFQACRGSYEFDGCFAQAPGASILGSFVQDALQQGHKFGIIASSDHGHRQSYACVLAERLERESIFQALRARRTYGATAKGLFVDFRIDDAVMGEAVVLDHAPKLKLTARGAAELADVAIYKDGALFQSLRRGSAPANSYAPVRLDLRLELAPGEGGAPMQLSLESAGGFFSPLQPGRGRVDPRSRPTWSVKSGTATLQIPDGLRANADGGALAFDVPIDLYVLAGGSLTLHAPSGDRTLAAGELVPQTIAGEAPGGSRFELRLSGADVAIDLARGLGTREFTGEWEDTSSAPGDSWYYARIIQTDREIAWSSPIFVTRKQGTTSPGSRARSP